MKCLDNPIIPYILFLFYMFHQLVMPEDTPLQTLAVVVYLLYAIFASVKLHKKYPSSFLYLLDIFLVIQVVYFLIEYPSMQFLGKNFSSIAVNQIKSVLVVMMPIYTYLWYGLRGKLTKKHIIWFSVAFIGLSIPQFYYLANQLMEQHAWINEWNETTNNTSYYFLQGFIFLPLLTYKKKLSLLILFVIVFYLILGVKRGAVFCFVCALPFYLRHLMGKTRIYVIPIIIVLFVVAANFLMDYFADMSYLQVRIEQTLEGDSSDRDVLWSKILNYVFETHLSFFGLLFGHGFNGSVYIAGNLAHNDWLELLSGFGLFSIFIYLSMIFSVIKFKKLTLDKDIKVCLTMGIIIWFLQTFFSMAYASTSFQFIVIFGLCGISLYENKQRKMEIRIKQSIKNILDKQKL